MTRTDRRIASPSWGLVRARYHFAAQFIRNKVVLDIAPDRSVASGILLQAGASSVARADPSDVSKINERAFDVVVCVAPGFTLSVSEHRHLRQLVRPGGCLVAAAKGQELEYAYPDAIKFRQVAPVHESTVASEPDPVVRVPNAVRWLRFLIRDGLARLLGDRGVFPGEYDFEFQRFQGEARTSFIAFVGEDSVNGRSM